MGLDIDTTQPLRTNAELSALVAAIEKATPGSEGDWVEWKSSMDLSSKVTQGHIARHILGMANRPVRDALLAAGGWGYIVIGAEPGSVAGVVEVDPATLDQALREYLGPNSPRWRMAYVQANGMSVLVVTVESPQPGDRIRTLDKEFDRYRRGTVFVRRPGRTITAEPQDIGALEDRFAAPLLEALRDRARDREREQQEKKRERLEKISEAVDDVYDVVKSALPNDRPPVQWTTPRQRLIDLLKGWDGPEMSKVQNFVTAGTAYQALMFYSGARGDLEQEFWRLDQET